MCRCVMPSLFSAGLGGVDFALVDGNRLPKVCGWEARILMTSEVYMWPGGWEVLLGIQDVVSFKAPPLTHTCVGTSSCRTCHVRPERLSEEMGDARASLQPR
jgi:hypothetical protein